MQLNRFKAAASTAAPSRSARRATALLGFAAAWLAGCGTYAQFTPTGDVPTLAPKQADEVNLYFEPDEPRCTYQVVGMYVSGSIDATSYGNPEVQPIREDAARRGFDGVMGLSCAAPGTVGSQQGRCVARAYVCEP